MRKRLRRKLRRISNQKSQNKWNAIGKVMSINRDQILLLKFKRHPRNSFLMQEFKIFR
jgi:hypothetical protein